MFGMSDYDGPAVLVSGLAEFPVTARLDIENTPIEGTEEGHVTTVGIISAWKGTLTSEDERIKSMIGSAAELRMPDGRTGRVHIPGGSYDMAERSDEPVILHLVGDGPAPWGEPV